MTAITYRACRRHIAAFIAILMFAAACSAAVDVSLSPAVEAPSSVDPPARNATGAANDSTPVVDFEVSDRWPASVRDYVDFVQTTRGEEFRIIADVRFVDPADLRGEFGGDVLMLDDLPIESQEIITRLDDMYRALGLSNEDFDILDAERAVTGDIAAFYDWEVGEIVFPAPDGQPADEITILDRPVLIHELGHALQIHSRVAWTQNLDDQDLSLALLEGEAEWLFDRYLRSLSDEEWRAWNSELPEWETSGQPEILEVEFAEPYVLGSRFFHARYAEQGIVGIDAAFEGRGRVTAQMLVDPWRFSGREVRQESFGFEWPEHPKGTRPVDISYDFRTSAVTWHQVLGTSLAGPDALLAARGINSFTVPVGWVDAADRFCFSMFANASIGKETIVEHALSVWAAVPGVERWFEPLDYGYEVGGCDPGAGNVPSPRATPSEVLGEVATIIDAEVWAVEAGLSPATGFCLGWNFLAIIENEPEQNFYEWLATADATATAPGC